MSKYLRMKSETFFRDSVAVVNTQLLAQEIGTFFFELFHLNNCCGGYDVDDISIGEAHCAATAVIRWCCEYVNSSSRNQSIISKLFNSFVAYLDSIGIIF